MAGEEAWKTRFRELVVEAEKIVWKIVYARAYLAPPMHAAAAAEVRIILQLPEQALENAAADLADATSLLGSARQLARRGGTGTGTGDAPDRPLPSILGLPNTTRVQREASRKARDARMLAIEAYHAMELCCDCLLTIRHLLHYPAPLLPGMDGVIEGQRAEAYELLVTAKEKVDACAELAARARDDVSGATD